MEITAVGGAIGTRLETTVIGLMTLVLPAGGHELVLEYASPRLPLVLPLVAWGLMGLA